jgi:hypothetical protein
MKLRAVIAATAAVVGSSVAAPTTSHFVARQTQALTQAAVESQHTAVYTTTVASDRDTAPQIITTVVVTLLMPVEDAHYPSQGAPLTGTAISHFSAAPSSSWEQTSELYWTLSGNVPLGVDTTFVPLPLGATTTLTSVHTWTEYRTSTYRNIMYGSGRYEWFSTARVTFVEGVGPKYPATIIRTGYTQLEVTRTGGNEAIGSTNRNVVTNSYWRTTTMVQVPTRPTPWPRKED